MKRILLAAFLLLIVTWGCCSFQALSRGADTRLKSKEALFGSTRCTITVLQSRIWEGQSLKTLYRSLRDTNALLKSRLDAAISHQALRKLDLSLRLEDETLLKSIAKKLRVSPPLNAPKLLWSFAWRVQCFFLPLLHMWDKFVPKDTCLNLAVLWWKAIAGDRVAYNLLPSITRGIVGWPLRFLFPRLHHQNVLLRTKFLDSTLRNEIDETLGSNIEQDSRDNRNRVAVISLGAGFDTRSIRFMNGVGKEFRPNLNGGGGHGNARVYREDIDYFELDLAEVIQQKRDLFSRYSQRQRSHHLPTLVEVNLNDLDEVERALTVSIFKDKTEDIKRHNKRDITIATRYKRVIVIAEAVLMYLDNEKVVSALKLVVDAAKSHSGSVSFIFSDRFPGVYEKLDKVEASTEDVNVAERERSLVADFLHTVDNKLDMVTWLPKPGRARHQGVGRFSTTASMMDEFPRLQGFV